MILAESRAGEVDTREEASFMISLIEKIKVTPAVVSNQFDS